MLFIGKVLRSITRVSCVQRTAMLKQVNTFPKCNRNFHTSTNLLFKMFMDRENSYAYSIMECNGYIIKSNTEVSATSLTKEQFEQLMNEDWSKLQPQQLFEVFSILGPYCKTHNLCISNKIFDDLIDHLTDNMQHASEKELEQLFFSLAQWPETESIRTRNFIEVWAALDDACLTRMKSWNYDKLLQFIALIYMLNVSRASEFMQKAINKLATKAKQLTPSQLVQTFFYVGIWRKQPFDMHNLEQHMITCFDKLSIDDIAIISMGFFKSKTPIRSMELMGHIIDKIKENPIDIHEVSLAALLKVIRYSVKIHIDDKIYELMSILQQEVPRLSVMCLIHLALLGNSTLTFHKECLTKIAERMIHSLPEARLKDLERLMLTYGTFGFKPKVDDDDEDLFFKKVIEELRKPERDAEIMKHCRSFSSCVCYLGLLGIYPIDLMEKVLSPEFLQTSYSRKCHIYGREILTINNNALIFWPEHKINHLSEKELKILAMKYTDYVPNEHFNKQYNVTEQMFLDVYKTLKEVRGSEYLKGHHILPHHQRGDIILCQTPDGKPLTVTDKFPKEFWQVKGPPDDNLWIALVIAGRNAIIHGTDKPSGHFLAKIRELKALGYHAALVLWTTYLSLKTNQEKRDYLDTLIKKALKYSAVLFFYLSV